MKMFGKSKVKEKVSFEYYKKKYLYTGISRKYQHQQEDIKYMKGKFRNIK